MHWRRARPAMRGGRRGILPHPAPPARPPYSPLPPPPPSADAHEPLPDASPRHRKADRRRRAARRRPPALGAPGLPRPRREPGDRAAGLLPAGKPRPDRGAAALGLLRARPPRAAPARTRDVAAARRFERAGSQRLHLRDSGERQGSGGGPLRFELSESPPVSARQARALPGGRGAPPRPAGHGHRPAAGQRGTAPADRPALPRAGRAGGAAGNRRHLGCDGGAQPLPAGGDPPRRPDRHRIADLLRRPAGRRAPRPQGDRDSHAPARASACRRSPTRWRSIRSRPACSCSTSPIRSAAWCPTRASAS